MEFAMNGKMCSCGKIHKTTVKRCEVGAGAVEKLIDFVKAKGASQVYVLSDVNTYRIAGERVEALLKSGGVLVTSYTFNSESLEPDERAVGSALMHYTKETELLIAVGSGVINDITKLVAAAVEKPYFVVATAPSMDGYASNSSSMVRDGLKVSIPAACPEVIIGDTDILKTAPKQMLISGLGDMLAKYVSICEWRIANYINGEYYCPEIAQFVKDALKRCVDNKDGLLSGDSAALEAVFLGLVACGQGMEFAGASRPASGIEHYFSHVWDMRGLEFGTPIDTHGIQCAVGTALAVKLYEKLREFKPTKKRAIDYASGFSFDTWADTLRKFLGKGAEAMIKAEANDGKYSVEKHKARIDRIIDGWDHILDIIDTSLPEYSELLEILESVGLPTTPEELGHSAEEVELAFSATRDIRDKYVLSRLAWDIGATDYLVGCINDPKGE